MQFPLWFKLLHTAFVCILVPAYWLHLGPANFLWFSDIALIVSVVAIWRESALLVSMQAVSVLALELAWNVDFLVRLVFGVQLIGLSKYMFEPKHPLLIRALSLFHIWLPILIVWMVYRLGYDRRAWLAQSLAACIILPVTYLLTQPSDNVNWVYGLGSRQNWMPPWLYLVLLMVALPVCVYWPTHLLLQRFAAK